MQPAESLKSKFGNQPVLAICLDGYEPSIAASLMTSGEMPTLQSLQSTSACFELDHGSALRTGLAGEHLATGLSPDCASRWAAVHFNPESYAVWQEGTRLKPFTSAVNRRCVVFDTTYFDLLQATETQGVVGWGAHDPGVDTAANPQTLVKEIQERFGSYPAKDWIYGTPWNSVSATTVMGDKLIESVNLRADVAEWLLTKRLSDWDLAIVTISEAHSAIEALWHGVDPTHPLHEAPSANAAEAGVVGVYKAIDRLLGKLTQALPEAAIVLFSMHGMGPNRSDAASFLMLPELLYRSEFNEPLFQAVNSRKESLRNGCTSLSERDNWSGWVRRGFENESNRLWSRISRRLRALVKKPDNPLPDLGPNMQRLDWMPATRYQPYWHKMEAFALPSFYDGRVRINLQGREKSGRVPLNRYNEAVENVIDLVTGCRDPITGETVVESVEVSNRPNPLELDPTESDIVFVWKAAPMSFVHPEQGQIGPVPYRRTGGHTGDSGFVCISADGVPAGRYGERSSFDVVPTLFELCDCDLPDTQTISGRSLLTEFR